MSSHRISINACICHQLKRSIIPVRTNCLESKAMSEMFYFLTYQTHLLAVSASERGLQSHSVSSILAEEANEILVCAHCSTVTGSEDCKSTDLVSDLVSEVSIWMEGENHPSRLSYLRTLGEIPFNTSHHLHGTLALLFHCNPTVGVFHFGTLT